MFELTNLDSSERKRRDGVWCDLHLPHGAEGTIRVRLLPFTNISMANRRRELIDAGADLIDAICTAYADVGVVEVDGATIRGEAVCDKRPLIREFVEAYRDLPRPDRGRQLRIPRGTARESTPPVTGHDAQDSQPSEG